MNPSDASLVLDIDSTDGDPMLIDSPADDARLGPAPHRDHRKPACLFAHLDEKQHALAFATRDLAGAGGTRC